MVSFFLYEIKEIYKNRMGEEELTICSNSWTSSTRTASSMMIISCLFGFSISSSRSRGLFHTLE